MKRYIIFFFSLFLIAGCATYKFQKGGYPYDKGYIVTRDKRLIPEYTVGPNNSAPDELALAKKRFKRRKKTVEQYYQKMGYIESRFKEMFLNPPALFVEFFEGLLRLPFIASRDRKYERDPEFRRKIDEKEEQEFAYEKEMRRRLKEELAVFIQSDLQKEGFSPQEAVVSAVVAVKPVQEAAVVSGQEAAPAVSGVQASAVMVRPQEESIKQKPPAPSPAAPPKLLAKSRKDAKERPVKKTKAIKQQRPKPVSAPVAVITARPQKGHSPLTVRFSAGKSYSRGSRIIAYEWDFGDGDTSTRKNPVNTFWSATYGSRKFEVKLAVTDNNGNSASTVCLIEVLTK